MLGTCSEQRRLVGLFFATCAVSSAAPRRAVLSFGICVSWYYGVPWLDMTRLLHSWGPRSSSSCNCCRCAFLIWFQYTHTIWVRFFGIDVTSILRRFDEKLIYLKRIWCELSLNVKWFQTHMKSNLNQNEAMVMAGWCRFDVNFVNFFVILCLTGFGVYRNSNRSRDKEPIRGGAKWVELIVALKEASYTNWDPRGCWEIRMES